MGGSLALGLRGHCAHLLGVDRDPAVVAMALEHQVVEAASTDLAELLPQADLVVIAVPVRASLEILHQLPDLHPGNPIIIDLGSTKSAVLQAMATLPGRFDPIGGHPMCGKETGTLANAEANLYYQASFALVPLPGTTPQARVIALELVALLGAHPLWLDAEEHDRWVAATSHLPHLLATALVLSTPFESSALTGPGFRSTSRLAAGSTEMKIDIFATNGLAVLEALTRFRGQLDNLEDCLRHGDLETLQQHLALGAEHRRAILAEAG
jgi:prephenate dehydrogenase